MREARGQACMRARRQKVDARRACAARTAHGALVHAIVIVGQCDRIHIHRQARARWQVGKAAAANLCRADERGV